MTRRVRGHEVGWGGLRRGAEEEKNRCGSLEVTHLAWWLGTEFEFPPISTKSLKM